MNSCTGCGTHNGQPATHCTGAHHGTAQAAITKAQAAAARELLALEVAHLLDAGESPWHIATALGTNPNALARRLQRAQHHTLAQPFERAAKQARNVIH